MRVALLADIHANIAALDAVLAEVRREGIAQLVLLGDFVGYFYEPRAVIEALAQFDCIAIRGNHDRMAIEARSDGARLRQYRSRYGSGLDAVIEQFDAEHWQWLGALPETRDVALGTLKVRLAHGAPFDPDAYIYPDSSQDRFAQVVEGFDGDAIWLGHTHWPMMRPGPPALVNPGSVGQPRDIGGLASWAIVHADTGVTAMRRTEFDVAGLQSACAARDPDRIALSRRLMRGRLDRAAA
ncbi:metallophosphoesterase family protein [Qipengyuania nanhaisediminis]|uniref:metallophosphoesterase family protein n=1 Tax=Qipengyuania nanhaisediminis TaxID=604088 RepID=UPI0038B4164F